MTAWKMVQARGIYAEGASSLANMINQLVDETKRVLAPEAIEILPIGQTSEVGDHGRKRHYFETLVLYGSPFVIPLPFIDFTEGPIVSSTEIDTDRIEHEWENAETILVAKRYTPEQIEAAARVNYWIRATAAKVFPKWEELSESHRAEERNTIRQIIRELEG